MTGDFDRLLREALDAPAYTWDFGWLEGRATEARPTWRFFDRVSERVRNARRLLDIDTGTGDMLAALSDLPPVTVATDSYEPSVYAATGRLRPRGVHFVQTQPHRQALPFIDANFDLIISRHPVETWWNEIARVLEPGGHYFSLLSAGGSPQPVGAVGVPDGTSSRHLATGARGRSSQR